MKFTVKGSNFLEGLKSISGSIASIDGRLTCGKFLLTKEEDSVSLFSTNGDFGAVTHVDLEKGSGKGFVVLPFDDMFDFSKRFPDDIFTFSIESNQCEITLDKSKHSAKIQVLADSSIFLAPPTGFDKFPASKKNLSKTSLAEAIQFVSPAQSEDPALVERRGVDLDGNRVIASDGRICLRHEVSGEVEPLPLSGESSSELLRLLKIGKEDDSVSIKQSGIWSFFKIGKSYFFSKVRPKTTAANLDRALEKCEKANKNSLKVSKAALSEALAVVRLATLPQDRRASFRLLKTKVVVQSQTRDGNTGTAEVSAEWTGDSGFETVLNLTNLELILKGLSGVKEDKQTDVIVFNISDSNTAPILITEGSKLALIQPSSLAMAKPVKAETKINSEAGQKVA